MRKNVKAFAKNIANTIFVFSIRPNTVRTFKYSFK